MEYEFGLKLNNSYVKYAMKSKQVITNICYLLLPKSFVLGL